MTVTVQDTFTEGTNTALASHTPDIDTPGGGWAVNVGSVTVIAATDTIAFSAANAEAAINGGTSGDVQLDVDFTANSADNRFAIYVKADASLSNGYALNGRPAVDDLVLYEVNSGTATEIDSITSTNAGLTNSGTFKYSLRWVTSGDIDVYIDDVQETGLAPTADTTHSALTYTGIIHNLYNGGGSADNYVVDDLASTTTFKGLTLLGVGT